MMADGSEKASALEPPRKSVELQDPGAHDLGRPPSVSFSWWLVLTSIDTSGDEEHFSDASEGQKRRNSRPPSPLMSRDASPIPRTRVERVDDEPRHGELPGSPAYEMRRQDAVPDELEILPEGRLSRGNSSRKATRSPSPADGPIPLTVVEKVDPDSPSHGEVPGTTAYEQRQADATPDVVLKASGAQRFSEPVPPSASQQGGNPGPVPRTIITRADSIPRPGEETGSAPMASDPNDVMSSVMEHGDFRAGKQ